MFGQQKMDDLLTLAERMKMENETAVLLHGLNGPQLKTVNGLIPVLREMSVGQLRVVSAFVKSYGG